VVARASPGATSPVSASCGILVGGMGSRGGSRLGGVLFVALTLACAKEPLRQVQGSKGAGGTTASGTGGTRGAPLPRDAAVDRLMPGTGTTDARPASGEAGADGAGGGTPPGEDGGAGQGGAGQGGAAGSAPDGGGPRPRVLSLVLDGAPWYATQATQGIAADAQGKVYVTDSGHVFMVDGATVSTYLTAAEAAGAADAAASTPRLGDLDIGPDGRLYFVTSWSSTTTGARLAVMRSIEPHAAQPWIDLTPTISDAQQIAVIDDGFIGLVSRTGFWTFSDAGGTLIYQPSQVYAGGCACEDLAADPSGTFLYQSGCNGYPLLRGQADGSGVGILYQASLTQPSTIAANNFLCVARDPSGGFYFVVQDPTDDEPRLYHVTEDAQGTSGLTWIETTPTFAQASQQRSNVFGFDYCSLATAPDGTVYFQSYAQLWKVSP